MSQLRRRLRELDSDGGMTIVEVVVALVVFALIATGVAAGSMSITRITADSRSREVAANLAAQELDAARAITDITDITNTGTAGSPAKTQIVSGRTYTITRTASWVGSTGSDVSCGSNENVQYRRVSVSVSWTGQLATTANVKSATLIAPRSRYTDAATGAISVRVIGVDGTPRSGIPVTITPVTDGAVLTKQPDPTDSDGCTYAPQLTPGTYKIQLSKSGYIDSNQVEKPYTDTAVVAAGSTAGWKEEYDQLGTFTTNYAGNFTAGTVQLPSTLDTTFIPVSSSYNIYLTSTRASSVKLYPFTSGYEAVAGTSADAYRAQKCASMDPVNWPATRMSGVQVSGVRAKATAPVGGTATFGTSTTQLSIPMGVVKVTTGLLGGYVSAQSATPTGNGNPGCTTTVTYSFSSYVTPGGSTYIALPYGSWTIYSASAFGVISGAVDKSKLAVQTNYDNNAAVTSSGGTTITTLDPRLPQ